jgi:hypothetical protein
MAAKNRVNTLTKQGQTIRSVRELSKHVGKSHVAVAGWVKRDDWIFGRGPWAVKQIPAILRWEAATLTPANTPSAASPTDINQLGPIKRADLKVKLERGQLLELDRKFRMGELHSKVDCETRRVSQIESAKQELLSIPDGLPFESKDKALVRDRIMQALQRLAT